MTETAILWLRRDLRLADNPALAAAMSKAERVLPLYIHAPGEEAPWAPGAASRWWLHGSLASLDRELGAHGSRLAITQGDSLETLCAVAREIGATQVHWNRLYDPVPRGRDTRIKLALREQGLLVESYNAALLREPWEVRTASGEPYRVYTAFWRKCAPELLERKPTATPDIFRPAPEYTGLPLAELGLLPRIRWDQGLAARWEPGEPAALARARTFVERDLPGYAVRRDLPGIAGTSALSASLHFGEIGPRRLLALIGELHGAPSSPTAETYVRELVWREFAYHLLFHYPRTPEVPLDPRFARFPWRSQEGSSGSGLSAEEALAAWQSGRTGIPLVDAGMRELWHTGWMHNRVRMAVASFLTKNLLIPWQAGARWFWDTLVDADLAANTLGWQWTAGCGADAAPYFRIFNPVRQGGRFDPDGDYVRRWCPELSGLPAKHIHQPWTAPEALLRTSGVRLGQDYPRPLVDLAKTRQEALAAFETIKRPWASQPSF